MDMAKYQSAEQWFPDKDIEGVFVEKGASGHMVAILETPEGDVYLRPGDWVITSPEGTKYRSQNIEFTWTAEDHNRMASISYLEDEGAEKLGIDPNEAYKIFVDALNNQKRLTPQDLDQMNEFMEWYRARMSKAPLTSDHT